MMRMRRKNLAEDIASRILIRVPPAEEMEKYMRTTRPDNIVYFKFGILGLRATPS